MKWWVLERPVPEPTEETAPFWDAVAEHRLVLQVCEMCGMWQYPPSPTCTRCLSPRLAWREASGRGTVFSFAVYHKAFHPAFADDVPYVVADIELEEGPVMLSNVVGCPPDAVRVGMPVSTVFELAGERIVLPRFAPDEGRIHEAQRASQDRAGGC